jgi:hypothetical protein
MADIPVASAVEEASAEEERQVKGLFDSLMALTKGVDDVVVCKTVAVFMATLMVKSDRWKIIIPGFMNHMDIGANAALTHHQVQEQRDASSEEGSTQESSDSNPPETKG